MAAERAAKLLDEKLRAFPWYKTVGVGATAHGETIFVYVRSARHPELTKLRDRWMGYPVLIRSIGSVRAIKDEHAYG